MKSSTKIFAAIAFCCGTAAVGWVSVQRVAAAPSVQTCGKLALPLQPGLVRIPGSTFHSFKPPKDMPLAPVSVIAPVFPGATRTAVTPDAEPSLIGTQYQETAVAAYSTASDLSTVYAWYKATLPGCGYSTAASGPGDTHHPPASYVFDSQAINMPNLNVNFTLQRSKSSGALISYFFELLQPPQRPKSAYVRFVAKSVRITYVFSGGQQAWHIDIPARRVTNFRETDPVANLEGVVDSSQTLSLGCGTGVGGPAYSATMTFIGAGGQRRTVSVDPQCNSFRVGNSRLIVDESAVWPTVRATVFHYCMGHPCKKTPVTS